MATIELLQDATRTALSFYAVGAAAGATTVETAITLTKSSGRAATSTGATFVPTVNKRFRITAIMFAAQGNAVATAQSTVFNVRLNATGAVTTTSTPVVASVRVATPATALAYDRAYLDLMDGYEIAGDGTLNFGVTAAATYTTNAPTWDVTLIGYEY